MQENINYGFFDQLPVAFFQPSKYKELIKKKKGYMFGFVGIITLLIILMSYIMPFMAWDFSVGGIENVITNGIPKFTLEHGTFQIESPLDIELSKAVHLRADSQVEAYKKEDLGESYVEEVLISKTNVILRHANMEYELRFSEMPQYSMNNETLLELLPMAKTTLIMTIFLMFLIEYVRYLLISLFYAFVCRIGIRNAEGRAVTFGEAFRFAIYARSLFTLLGCLNSCLGYYLSPMLSMLLEVYFSIRWMAIAQRSFLGIPKRSFRNRNDFDQ